MTGRFADLKKIPNEPAARMLALANARLSAPLKAPASAPVQTVLEELDAAGATVDMLRLLAIALPPRERTWWACLAARDTLPPGSEKVPPPLAAAEAWVFKPSDAARDAARVAAESAEVGDDTSLCATAVAMCDGKLGTGDLAEHAAPAGVAEAAVFGMAVLALSARADRYAEHGQVLIDRALDIARGGSGRLAPGPEGTS